MAALSTEELTDILNHVANQLQPFLPLANVHMVDFFTCNDWETILPDTLTRDLDEIEETMLCKILAPIGEESAPLLESIKCALPSLHEFLSMAHSLHLRSLGVLSTKQQVYQYVGVGAELPTVSLGRVMREQKTHEVQNMSQLLATLCQELRVDWLCDLGAGKGYLSSVMAMHYNMNVLAVDSSPSNVSAAASYQRILQNELNHQKNLLKKKNNETKHDEAETSESSREKESKNESGEGENAVEDVEIGKEIQVKILTKNEQHGDDKLPRNMKKMLPEEIEETWSANYSKPTEKETKFIENEPKDSESKAKVTESYPELNQSDPNVATETNPKLPANCPKFTEPEPKVGENQRNKIKSENNLKLTESYPNLSKLDTTALTESYPKCSETDPNKSYPEFSGTAANVANTTKPQACASQVTNNKCGQYLYITKYITEDVRLVDVLWDVVTRYNKTINTHNYDNQNKDNIISFNTKKRNGNRGKHENVAFTEKNAVDNDTTIRTSNGNDSTFNNNSTSCSLASNAPSTTSSTPSFSRAPNVPSISNSTTNCSLAPSTSSNSTRNATSATSATANYSLALNIKSTSSFTPNRSHSSYTSSNSNASRTHAPDTPKLLPSAPPQSTITPDCGVWRICVSGLHTCGDLAAATLRAVFAAGVDEGRRGNTVGGVNVSEDGENPTEKRGCPAGNGETLHARAEPLAGKGVSLIGKSESSSVKGIVVAACSVGCCYHLLTEAFDDETDYRRQQQQHYNSDTKTTKVPLIFALTDNYGENPSASSIANTGNTHTGNSSRDTDSNTNLTGETPSSAGSAANTPGFPLSRLLNLRRYRVGRNARMIAAQPVSRLLSGVTSHNTELHFWRALLQLVIVEKLAETHHQVCLAPSHLQQKSQIAAKLKRNREVSANFHTNSEIIEPLESIDNDKRINNGENVDKSINNRGNDGENINGRENNNKSNGDINVVLSNKKSITNARSVNIELGIINFNTVTSNQRPISENTCCAGRKEELRVVRSFSVGRRLARGCKTFPEYAHLITQLLPHALRQRVQATEAELQQLEQQQSAGHSRMNKVVLLRASLAPVVEGLILLDRLLFAKQQDSCQAAFLLKLFDPLLSPRHAIVIVKRGAKLTTPPHNNK